MGDGAIDGLLNQLQSLVREHDMADLMTTHDLKMALQFAESVLLLSKGEIIVRVSAREAMASLIERTNRQAVTMHSIDGLPAVVLLAQE